MVHWVKCYKLTLLCMVHWVQDTFKKLTILYMCTTLGVTKIRKCVPLDRLCAVVQGGLFLK